MSGMASSPGALTSRKRRVPGSLSGDSTPGDFDSDSDGCN